MTAVVDASDGKTTIKKLAFDVTFGTAPSGSMPNVADIKLEVKKTTVNGLNASGLD